MSAPTTTFTPTGAGGTGTITATGESNGLLLSPSPLIAYPRTRFGFSGSFTSCVVAVRGRLRGLTNFYPVRAVFPNGNVAIADAGNISLVDNTNQSVEIDCAGFDEIEVYVVSGTPTSLVVEEITYANSSPMLNVVNTTISGTQSYTAASTITVASANALDVGPNGATNPTLQVDTSTASAATGLKVKSAAAAGGMALSVISSGGAENLTVDAKGSGTVTIGGTSTGSVKLGAGAALVVVPGTLTGGGLLTCGVQVATSGPIIYSGSGVPTISAAVKGSLYLRTDGTSGSTRAYIASDTAGTWTAITTAA